MAPSVPPAPLMLYTSGEAAAILRVRQSWLERQAATRKIPFAMLGGSYRFTTEHLAQIVRIFEAEPSEQVARQKVAVPRQRQRVDVPRASMPLQPRPRKRVA
jgi:excisionase family DNA binding protein